MDYKSELLEFTGLVFQCRIYEKMLNDYKSFPSYESNAKAQNEVIELEKRITDLRKQIDNKIEVIANGFEALEQIEGMIKNAASPYDVNINVV